MTQVNLHPKEGESICVDKTVACQSDLIRNLIEDDFGSDIPLPLVSRETLEHVMTFCKGKQVEGEGEGEGYSEHTFEMTAFEKNYVAQYTFEELKALAEAANYLSIKRLVDIMCHYFATLIKDKTVEEVKVMFDLVDVSVPDPVPEATDTSDSNSGSGSGPN